MIGQTVSHYRVIEKLGGGGMGVVYRAEDTRLRRSVALKVLPPDLTRDAEAKERFVLEAQAASALDHPNICTVHEIDETPEGQIFLVMAYYPGETLKKKIDRGPLKLDEALDYAVQIAQGLKKAHESKIVHRDIKPANVLVTTDGLVKIVDFGLAKLLNQSGLTRTGTTLGTVSYMSPEQALAQPVDARSDLWSLGVLLHEMIAGQLPFRGDNQLAVANAIAHTPAPPLTSVRTGVPMELDRVVGRALSKSPDDRYQTAADFLSELRRVRRESDGQSSLIGAGATPVPRATAATPAATTGAAQPAAMPRRKWIGLAIAGLAAVSVIGYFALTSGKPAEPAPLLSNPVQIAASIGVEHYPSWSPDGRMIAYQSNQTGNSDIWVTQLGGGPPINRTADHAGIDQFPRWSPDGRQIAFHSDREGGGVFVMSALAGSARKIAPPFSLAAAPPAWSPDGSEIAYAIADGNAVFLERQNLRDSSTRRIALAGRKGNARIDLAWSPDGTFIAYLDARNYTAQVTQLLVLRLADGQAVALTDGRTNDWSPTWTPDSRTVYFASNRGGAMDLWRQRVADDGSPAGGAERLTTGLEVASAALSPDGQRLAYVKGRWLGNVWRAPILADRPATWADAQQLTFDQAHIEYLNLSRDGRRLAVSSDRTGNPDIWLLPAAGGEMQPLTTDPTPDWNPDWSPDGGEIVFYAYRSGNRELWVQPIAGGAARQLTRGETESVFPAWSPDGKWIVYNTRIGGSMDLWMVPAAGGEARQILGDPSLDGYPSWSPDGNSLAFQSDRGGVVRVWRMPAAGGQAAAVSKGPGSRPKWSRDGKWIYFLRLENGRRDVWVAQADGTAEHRITDFTGRRGMIEINAFATDSKFVYFTWRDDVADIWAMDVVVKR